MKRIIKQELNQSAQNAMKLAGVGCLLGMILLTMSVMAWAAPSPDAPIWRAQLRVQVADVEDAGTDDKVFVSLAEGNAYGTWIDSSEDDMERGRTYVYDLMVTTRNPRFYDLKRFLFKKEGSDGLCIKSFALLINEREIFTRTFSGVGRWFDNAGTDTRTYEILETVLKSTPQWWAYQMPVLPPGPSKQTMESRIEMNVGHALTRMFNENGGQQIKWGRKFGPRFVEITKSTTVNNAIHVDLDLETLTPPFGLSREVDVDLDIRVTCVGYGALRFDLHRAVFRFSLYGITTDHEAALRYADLFSRYIGFGSGFGVDAERSFGESCPTYFVNNDGSVFVNFNSFPLAAPPVLSNTEATQVSGTSGGTINELTAEPLNALEVNFDTRLEAAVGVYTPYTVIVKSNAAAHSDVQVQIELPRGVVANGAHLTVADGKDARVIEAQLVTTKTGTTMLSFADGLGAGETASYTVQLWFGEQPAGETFVTTTVSGKVLAALVVSRTSFKVANGKVQPQGTVQFAGQKTEGTEVGNPRQ